MLKFATYDGARGGLLKQLAQDQISKVPSRVLIGQSWQAEFGLPRCVLLEPFSFLLD